MHRRRLKMAESAHAYVRGNTIKFYDWLEQSEAATQVPAGPAVWICGDCHIGNLGPVASAEGRVEIEIRDLDQTVIGNPAHDLIRLSLSLAMAARSSDLPGVTTSLMLEEVMRGYQHALLKRPAKVQSNEVEPLRIVMKQALNRKWRHLAEERIEDVTPKIPLGKRFWALSRKERVEIERLFTEKKVQQLATCLKHRGDDDKVTVLDAAYWMKGCSSLGRLRFAVLAGVGEGKSQEFALIDIKEATRAAAPRDAEASMPRNNAERVVAGARALSPYLGERMFASHFDGKAVVLRELMPQDLKFEMENLTQQEAVASANLFAGIVGKAHARQMDGATRRAWAAEMGRSHSRKLDAPSWLWNAVVDLAAGHEAAYLHHCRDFALGVR
jgi:uncharacterized protein (DUF2252 family)